MHLQSNRTSLVVQSFQSNIQASGGCNNQCVRTTRRPEADQNQIPAILAMVPKYNNQSSQDARKRTLMSTARSTPANTQTTSNISAQLILSKRSNTIEVLFKEEKFSGAPDECIDLKPRDFHIIENNHSVTNDERSQLVVSCLKGIALEFYVKEISPQMPYEMFIDKLGARYNTPHRKLSLRSEVYSFNFDDFMARQQIQDEKEFLCCTADYLKNITPQLVDGFHTESNKIRYLRSAVLGKKCATTALKNISTAQYDFEKLGMQLNESIQPERRI